MLEFKKEEGSRITGVFRQDNHEIAELYNKGQETSCRLYPSYVTYEHLYELADKLKVLNCPRMVTVRKRCTPPKEKILDFICQHCYSELSAPEGLGEPVCNKFGRLRGLKFTCPVCSNNTTYSDADK